VVTPVVGAEVPVVANNTLTRVLFANAVYADAGLAVPVAGTSVMWNVDALVPRQVIGALVTVVARVLSADTGYADAVKTIEVAVRPVLHGHVVAPNGHGVAPIVGAFVLVVAVLVALTFRRLAAPNHRNDAQRADT
jgi:hypothetical protein